MAIPIASDDSSALAVAAHLIHDAGFDAVAVGELALGEKFEPGTNVYNTGMSVAALRKALG